MYPSQDRGGYIFHFNSILAQSEDALPRPLSHDSLPEPTEATAGRLARLRALCLALTAAVTVQQAADVVIHWGFQALNATAGSMYLLETKLPSQSAGVCLRPRCRLLCRHPA